MMEDFIEANHHLLQHLRSRDTLTFSWWENNNNHSMNDNHISINMIAISDALGGVVGPSNLYEEMVKQPYERVLFARVDIACPLDAGKKLLLAPSKHFEYAVYRVVEVARSLYARNNKPVVLMGWAMGGAVVIESAFRLQQELLPIRGIITLACQSRQTDNLKHLSPQMFKAFLHGSADNSLSASISERLYEEATFFMNKESWCSKHILPKGDHKLSQYVSQIHLYVGQVLQHICLLESMISGMSVSSTIQTSA